MRNNFFTNKNEILYVINFIKNNFIFQNSLFLNKKSYFQIFNINNIYKIIFDTFF